MDEDWGIKIDLFKHLKQIKMKFYEGKNDLLTGERFVPKRKNQKFANSKNQVKYNNRKKKKTVKINVTPFPQKGYPIYPTSFSRSSTPVEIIVSGVLGLIGGAIIVYIIMKK